MYLVSIGFVTVFFFIYCNYNLPVIKSLEYIQGHEIYWILVDL